MLFTLREKKRMQEMITVASDAGEQLCTDVILHISMRHIACRLLLSKQTFILTYLLQAPFCRNLRDTGRCVFIYFHKITKTAQLLL